MSLNHLFMSISTEGAKYHYINKGSLLSFSSILESRAVVSPAAAHFDTRQEIGPFGEKKKWGRAAQALLKGHGFNKEAAAVQSQRRQQSGLCNEMGTSFCG